jgi:hypothetical protein
VKINFVSQEDGKILIDVRKAALVGAREIEVYLDEETNTHHVEIRKTRSERVAPTLEKDGEQ